MRKPGKQLDEAAAVRHFLVMSLGKTPTVKKREGEGKLAHYVVRNSNFH